MYRLGTGVRQLFRRAAVLFLLTFVLVLDTHPISAFEPPSQSPRTFSARDRSFLEDLERRSFQYFWEHAGASTGLVLDRTRTDGAPADEDHRTVASIAATGFGLTAICIGAERGWVKRDAARERVRTTLRFFADHALQEHGWFYHWMDVNTGARMWKSEVSSIDTALLLAGALTARQYFHDDAEIVRLATVIYERIDFPWMLNGHPTLLSMGWRPESNFIKARWDDYSEHPILYLLAIGSPTHPITTEAWYAWKRNWNYYKGYKYLGATPLFTYQYSHAWVDFRGRREASGEHIDYFANSVTATLAHRQFCLDLAKEFPSYGPNVWGISASDSVKGYVAWGGPPRDPAIDGTVVPYAAAGSSMFVPTLAVAALKTMRAKYPQVYGKYGFADAFNPNTGWIDRDVIGIDLGITILGVENARSEFVWRWFMKNPEINNALKLVELKKTRVRERTQQTPLRKAA
ncbi:MAG TPA: glucoamylase family protein [Pyrinomonadaceae bacterium]|nr:glucoamylase family protein [Pyrinomonadaceae bacterium]